MSPPARVAAVLKTMKRGAGARHLLKTLEKVRAAVPGIALRTQLHRRLHWRIAPRPSLLEEFIAEAKSID